MQLSPGWEQGKDLKIVFNPKTRHLSQRENEQLQVPGGISPELKQNFQLPALGEFVITCLIPGYPLKQTNSILQMLWLKYFIWGI